MLGATAGMLCLVVLPLGLGGASAYYQGSTGGQPLLVATDDLDAYLPTAVSSTRTDPTTCRVSWTVSGSAPPGLVYDVRDGTGAMAASGVGAGPVSITVPAGQTMPTVDGRLGAWRSSSAASTPCPGYPSAPTGLTLAPGEQSVTAGWSAAAGNGAPVTSYSASASPGGAACTATAPATSCTLPGLTNGITYTVSVTATSSVGTGPAATGSAIPYPASVMTAARMRLWLDAADPATTLDSPSCAGGAAQARVGCWRDKSGQAHDVSAPDDASRPATGSRTLGGHPVVTFDGATVLRDAADSPYGITGDRTLVAVARPRTVQPGAGIEGSFVLDRATDGDGLFGLKVGADGDWSLQARDDTRSTLSEPSSGVAPAAGRADVLAGTRSGTGDDLAVRGAAAGSAVLAGPVTQHGAAVGRHAVAVTSSDLDVAEVVLLNVALTGAQRRAVEEYLARKWSSVITPQAPTTLVATPADGQATIAWTAPDWDGGAPVTGTTVTAVPSDPSFPTVRLACAGSPCTVGGLTNGLTYTVSAVAANSVGAGPASAAITTVPYPSTVMSPSRLVLWLDGADPTTMYASSSCTGAPATSTVGCWKDKSASHRNTLTAATPSAAPVLGPDAGRSVPTFDGVDDALTRYSTADLPTGANPSTTVVAATRAGSVTNRDLLSWGGASPTRARAFYLFETGGVVADTYYSGSSVLDGYPAAGTPFLSAAQFGAGYAAIATNGNRPGATSAPLVSTDAAGLVALGGVPGLGYWWQGPIPEAIALNSTLTSAQARQVEEYLARKWATPITPQAPASAGAVAVAADGSASVTLAPPVWDGGSPVTSYTVWARPADPSLATVTAGGCASSPCPLTGLVDGASYTVSVAAVNARGTGPATTAATDLVAYPADLMTPSRLALWLDGADPSVRLVSAACSGAAATLTLGCWKDKSGHGDDVTASGSSAPALVSVSGRSVPSFDGVDDVLSGSGAGLPAGTSTGAVLVAGSVDPAGAGAGNAVLAYGGATSGGQRRVTSAGAAAVDVAGAPSAVSATGWPGGGGQGVVVGEFAAGSELRVWARGSAPAGAAGAWSTGSGVLRVGAGGLGAPSSFWTGTAAEVVVFSGGLTDAERRRMEAYLARKWGGPITPDAPTRLSATAGAGQAVLTWSAPAWSGGSPVTGSRVTASPGGATCTGTTTCTITGLTNGSAYTFTVTAANAVGDSAPSAPSAAVTPRTVPGAPTGVAATDADASSVVSWTAPAQDGGSPVTGYLVTAVPSDGSAPVTCSSGPAASCTLTPLTNGLSYAVSVQAANAAGRGPASAAVSTHPVGLAPAAARG